MVLQRLLWKFNARMAWLQEFKKWHGKTKLTQRSTVPTWKKPESGWLKCNFDWTWEEHGGVGGVGVVIRDDTGTFACGDGSGEDSCYICPLQTWWNLKEMHCLF
ncbi:unnamed protein product [Malus baccata var. baccata]